MEPTRLIVWSDDFRVGVAEIDDQHRRLIEMLGAFYESLACGEGQAGLGALLKGLLDYAGYHFATEERLMRLHGYDQALAHLAEHAHFVAQATDMAQRFADGQLILSLEATGFIRTWLSRHILATDRQLGQFLATRQ